MRQIRSTCNGKSDTPLRLLCQRGDSEPGAAPCALSASTVGVAAMRIVAEFPVNRKAVCQFHLTCRRLLRARLRRRAWFARGSRFPGIRVLARSNLMGGLSSRALQQSFGMIQAGIIEFAMSIVGSHQSRHELQPVHKCYKSDAGGGEALYRFSHVAKRARIDNG